jgi:hypothetical protein
VHSFLETVAGSKGDFACSSLVAHGLEGWLAVASRSLPDPLHDDTAGLAARLWRQDQPYQAPTDAQEKPYRNRTLTSL